MSFACFEVIYGIPLYSGDDERTEELEDFLENEQGGVCTFYSGSSHLTPAAFGVKLDGFDECCSFIDLSSLTLQPNVAQLQEYERYWNALDQETQQMLKEQCGEPRVFFLTSTS